MNKRQTIKNGLYLVIGTQNCLHYSIEKIVKYVLKAGVIAVQLREKNLDTKTFINLAQKLHAITRGCNVPLIINDRIDIAIAVNAEGVHIGQQDMPYNLARQILGNDKIIGMSTNNEEHIKATNMLDIDYIGIGPVFNTNTKDISSKNILGIEEASKLFKLSKHKAFAIGGIKYSNASDVLKSVPTGIAVVTEISESKNPYQSALNLIQLFNL